MAEEGALEDGSFGSALTGTSERYGAWFKAARKRTSGNGPVRKHVLEVLKLRDDVMWAAPLLFPANVDFTKVHDAATTRDVAVSQLSFGAATPSAAAALEVVNAYPALVAVAASAQSQLAPIHGVSPTAFGNAVLTYALAHPLVPIFPLPQEPVWDGHLLDPPPTPAPGYRTSRAAEYLTPRLSDSRVFEHFVKQLAGYVPGNVTVGDCLRREGIARTALAGTGCPVSREAYIDCGRRIAAHVYPGFIVKLKGLAVAPAGGTGAGGGGGGADTAPAATERLALVQAFFACEAVRPPGPGFAASNNISLALVHVFEKTSTQLAAKTKGFVHARGRTLGPALGGQGAGPALDVIRISDIVGIARYRPLCIGNDTTCLYTPAALGAYVPIGETSFLYDPEP